MPQSKKYILQQSQINHCQMLSSQQQQQQQQQQQHVKLSPCLIKHDAMKTYGGVEI
jgi:hypothetical protein